LPLGALFALCFAIPATAAELPRLVTKDGRHALLVDGAPYLILGGQAHNSSNYPDMLPEVWPTIKAIHLTKPTLLKIRFGIVH
jgi:hypothetical protein